MTSQAPASTDLTARPGDKELSLFVSSLPIRNAKGEVVGAVEIINDQTEIVGAQMRMLDIAQAADVISERLSSASEELSAQAEQVATGSEVQRSRISETATAMEQMNASVIEVAKNASSASANSTTARAEAEQGSAVVTQAVQAISDVHAATAALQENMRSLGQQAEAIGAVMNVISDIADQTNLLALNAAIEAARAGDAGRGFAVVADEVRKLAEKTMGATKEVGGSIGAIQEAARRNIESMAKAAQVVEQANRLANDSGEALRKIVGLIGQNSGQIEEIAAAAEEQSAASEQINRAVEEVNRVVAETTEGMVQSSKAIQELSTMSSELRELIASLKGGETGRRGLASSPA